MPEAFDYALARICKGLEQLEIDYESKSPSEQEHHIYRSLLMVLHRFLEDEQSAIEIETSIQRVVKRPKAKAVDA